MRKEHKLEEMQLTINIWYAMISKRGYFNTPLDYKNVEEKIFKTYRNIKKTIIHKAFWHYVKKDINFLKKFEY